jgi:hypothetical protein
MYKWKERGSGMGGWEIGEGVGWEERGLESLYIPLGVAHGARGHAVD